MTVKRVGLLIIIFLMLSVSFSASALGTMDYIPTTDSNGNKKIPQTHQISEVIRYLGDEGGSFSNPRDIFVDSNDNIYVVDTGNNRIVKLDSSGNYVRSYSDGGKLSQPAGVFVDADGDLYISDSLNERIVHVNSEDEYVEEFVRPESELLEDDMSFQTGRIAITNQGYLYLIKGQNFMAIDANNQFRGFVGANELGFSLKRLFIRMFASQEQKSKLKNEEPPAYSSFDIGPDGMIYATAAEDKKSAQIQKINAVGENIYPENLYGELYYNSHTKKYNSARFTDISVAKDGMVYVTEQYSKQIYVYDTGGACISVFGGEGNIKGKFTLPVAIETNSSGDVLVLDSSTGYIHIFKRTNFMNNVVSAILEFDAGEYDKSQALWEQVLEIDINYEVANRGLGLVLHKKGEIEEAMRCFKIAEDRQNYGEAFSDYQYKTFRENFGLAVFLIAVILTTLVAVIWLLRKKANNILADYYKN